jgi:rRNA maturation endonuclease Nob1
MIPIDVLMDIIATDAVSPNTHRCNNCRNEFSPNGDSCPLCGTDVSVSLVSELQEQSNTPDVEKITFTLGDV